MPDGLLARRLARRQALAGAAGLAPAMLLYGHALAQPLGGMTQIEQLCARAAVIDVVNAVGLLADLREWPALRACFADEVLVDYTSRDGGQPVRMKADDLVEGWRKRLGGFSATQHLISNHLMEVEAQRAVCRSTFKSQHRLETEQWDLDGRYRHELTQAGRIWRVSAMQMVGDFERGNRRLVERAAMKADRP